MEAPKVFVSHASEDKQRFVLAFAERLRANGIDAWVDRWEMLPGDSLIDKLFEEGLKNASAVIVVLSVHSVEKPWVREELNAAAVARINKGTKLIPVVIDDCDVPEVLKSLLWEWIEDLTSYDDSFNRIVSAIFGTAVKPPLGQAPAHVMSAVATIGGLSKLDSFVLRTACEHVLATDLDHVETQAVFCKDGAWVVPESELRDSVQVLEEEQCIETAALLSSELPSFKITTYGFDQYIRAAMPDFGNVERAVIAALVNNKLQENNAIAGVVQQPRRIVDHVLELLATRGLIKRAELSGYVQHIFQVSPSLARSLQT